MNNSKMLFGLGGTIVGAFGTYMAMAPKGQTMELDVKSDPKDLSNFPLPSTITDLKYSQKDLSVLSRLNVTPSYF